VCEAHGGRIWEPRKKNINDQVLRRALSIRKAAEPKWKGIWSWIGIEKNGSWMYQSNGEELTFSNWRDGKVGGSGCARGHSEFSYYNQAQEDRLEGKWETNSCNYDISFICEF